jgi:hypothetical protein
VIRGDVSSRLAAAHQAVRRINADRRWLQDVADRRRQHLPADHPYRQGPTAEAASDVATVRTVERDSRMESRARSRTPCHPGRSGGRDCRTRRNWAARSPTSRLRSTGAGAPRSAPPAGREPLVVADADRDPWLVEHPIAERRLERIARTLKTSTLSAMRHLKRSNTTARTAAAGWPGTPVNGPMRHARTPQAPEVEPRTFA